VLDLSFDSGNALGIFKMTSAAALSTNLLLTELSQPERE